MFESTIVFLDWFGIIVFATTGALVASRKQMDLIGFILLGTVTGIGGGTVRDVMLGLHPILWVERPEYLAVCVAVSTGVFFTAHLVHSRYRILLWLDALGVALFAVAGAERALLAGAGGLVAVAMGVITATFGGIIRDVLGQERSIIFSREIYVTAALASALVFVLLAGAGIVHEAALAIAVGAGFLLRAGALIRGWSLPRYRPRPGREPDETG